MEPWQVPFEAYTGDEPYIFVSYSHADKDPVYSDLTDLHRMRFRIWYDEGILPGRQWPVELANALHRCSQVIVFISENSVASRNVVDEIFYALNHSKDLLVIYLSDTDLPPHLEMKLGNIQAIMRHRLTREVYLKKLSASLFRDGGTFLRAMAFEAPGLGEEREIVAAEELDPILSQIARFHRLGHWDSIRRLSKTATASLIHHANSDLKDCQRLSDLGIHLTDAQEDVLARRCFDVSIETLLSIIRDGNSALAIRDQLGMVYNNLARLLRKNFPASRSAESFYRKSLEIFKILYPDLSDDPDLGDRLGMAYSNLGNSLRAQGKTEAAKAAYQGAVRIYERILRDYPGDERLRRRLERAVFDLRR